MLKGLLLKESLIQLDILNRLQVTGSETWNIQNPADYQPSVWTAVRFETDDRQADHLAEELSRFLKPRWFIDASTDSLVYVIFPGKVFKYPKGDQEQREVARQYGLRLEIPERQLDWGE